MNDLDSVVENIIIYTYLLCLRKWNGNLNFTFNIPTYLYGLARALYFVHYMHAHRLLLLYCLDAFTKLESAHSLLQRRGLRGGAVNSAQAQCVGALDCKHGATRARGVRSVGPSSG